MMKRGIVFFIFVCLAVLTFSCKQEETKESTALFPVEQNGKWGYIDKTGRMVIEPQFDRTWDFSEGLGCVWIAAKE